MNRLLLVLNALLALVLLLRVFTDPSAVAAASVFDLAPDRLSVDVQRTADGRVPSFVVHLGAALRPEGATDAPVDLGVRLDPPMPLLTSWKSERQLVVVPARPLPGSRHCRVVFAQELRGAGKRLPAGTIVPFTTPAVALEQILLVDGETAEQPALRLVFDQAVTADAVQQHVRVVAADDHAVDVPVAVELPPDQAQANVVVLRPRAAGRLPDLVDVIAAAELVASGGEVAAGRATAQRVRWQDPLRVTGFTANDEALELQFTHEVPLPLAEQLRLQPASPFQLQRSDGGLRLLGDFAPGTVVTVELAAGFPGHGRHRLAQATRRSLLLPDRTSRLAIAQGGQVLCASALPQLAIEGVNVERVRARLQRVYANNLVRALQRADTATFAPAAVQDLGITAARNETWKHTIDLAALAGAPLRGLYQFELWHGQQSWPVRRWLQATDLGITWRAGRDGAAVHVRDLVRGEAVAGAAVTLLTPTNQVLASGATDAQGTLLVSWPAGGDDQRPFVVLAQRFDDVAFASLGSDAVELADDGLGGRAFAGEQPEAWLWPDRGIVRPGETIDVVALVRDQRGLPVPGRALAFRFLAPNGRPLRVEAFAGSGSGLATAELALPPDAPMGTHTVAVVAADGEAVLGSTTFRVEAFVPDRLEAEVVAIAPLRFGGLGTVAVRGRWLDGSPAAGRAVAARVRLLPHTASFPGAEGFSFASASEEPPPGELPTVNGTLDARGEATLEFALPAVGASQTLLAHVAVEVLDPSGRPVRAAMQAVVLRPDLHVGLRATAGGCELRAVDADGVAVRGAVPATVRLERRAWRWRYEAAGGGRWRWQTTREATALGEWNVVLQDGAATLVVPPADDECALVATAAGRSVECLLGRASARPDRLRVRALDDAVAAGGTARLVVTSPAAGLGWITLEGDRVHAAHTCALQRGDTTIEVPVPAGLQLPNVHAVVTLTRPVPDSGPDRGPAWLAGGAPIRLLRPELALPLTLTAPASIEPDHEWHATLHAPGACAAVVAVVDEGVLRVTGHAVPDPLAFFLATRALRTDGADNGSSLLQSMQFAAGTKAGGDGDDDLDGLLAGGVDTRIRPLVRFAAVPLDAEGRGSVHFAFGGHEGRVRAVAIAAGPVGMAVARADTVVQAPLSVQVATPRMVAPGDRFVLPVTLRNSLAAGTVTLRVAAEGALQLDGLAEHTFPLASGAEAAWEVKVVAQTPAPGTSAAALRVVAELGQARREVVAEFSVRQPVVAATETLGIDLAGGGDITVAPAWQQVQATVRLDSRPEALLAGVLTRLLDYPYGCAEQTMAKGMALLACRTMLPRLLAADDARLLTANALTQAAVDRLLGMQTWSGGFGFWPGAAESPFVTAMVTDFLVQARQHGLEVPESPLTQALDRCVQLLRRDHDVSLRCLAADVLARAGRPVQPWLDWLCTAAVTADDRCHLAVALGHLGEARRALALLQDDGDTPPSAAAFGELASPLRSTALRVRAMGAADAARPELPALAARLQRALQATHTTTQEQWQGLRALAEYYRRQPAPDAAAVAALTVDGAPCALTGASTKVSLHGGSVLHFAAGGNGAAVVELRGLRLADDAPQHGTLTVERTLLDADTGLVVDRCRRGRLYEVRLVVTSPTPIEHLAVVDLLPGGLEPEPPSGLRLPPRKGVVEPDCVQRGDDRVLLFCRRTEARVELRHRVRATLPGTWSGGSVRAEAMYAPESRCCSGRGRELVVEP